MIVVSLSDSLGAMRNLTQIVTIKNSEKSHQEISDQIQKILDQLDSKPP